MSPRSRTGPAGIARPLCAGAVNPHPRNNHGVAGPGVEEGVGRPLGNWHFIEVCGIWLREREGGAFRAEGIAAGTLGGWRGHPADVRGARRGSCERSAGGILGQEIGILTPYKFGSPGLETAVGGDGHSPVQSITGSAQLFRGRKEPLLAHDISQVAPATMGEKTHFTNQIALSPFP